MIKREEKIRYFFRYFLRLNKPLLYWTLNGNRYYRFVPVFLQTPFSQYFFCTIQMQFDGIENAAKVILKFVFSNYKTKLSMNRLEVFIFLELIHFCGSQMNLKTIQWRVCVFFYGIRSKQKIYLISWGSNNLAATLKDWHKCSFYDTFYQSTQVRNHNFFTCLFVKGVTFPNLARPYFTQLI